jgi:hypothetical protein
LFFGSNAKLVNRSFDFWYASPRLDSETDHIAARLDALGFKITFGIDVSGSESFAVYGYDLNPRMYSKRLPICRAKMA